MRNAIREYLGYTDDEKKALWDNATMVFDTNVFLNLYRYSAKTRGLLLSSLDKFKDRLWMPNHIACEFMKNRNNIIWETKHQYEQLTIEANKFTESCRSSLNLDKDDADLATLKQQIAQWIESAQKRNIEVTQPESDKILDTLLSLFEEKVGMAFSDDDLKTISEEAKKRYAAKIPPGYKDSEKQKGDSQNNVYGDLIVWKQILKYAKANKTDIIFVTNDQKEDWWEIIHGQTIGPRVELRKEFITETNQRFHMYSMSEFIRRFEGKNNATETREAVDEIEFFSQVIRHKTNRKILKEYYKSFENANEARAAKMRYEIMRLENKNRKRMNTITFNQNKYINDKMPPEISELVDNNIANYERDVGKIEKLQSQLQILAME